MATVTDNAFRDLLFDVRRSARYHVRRRDFYEHFHACVLFLALIFGSATLAAFGAELGKDLLGTAIPLWVKLSPAVLTSVFSAADLVIGSTRKVWLHSDLARRFIELERTLQANRDELTDELITEMTDKRLAIESDEPRALRVLDTLCYNEMLRAMGYPPEQQIRVGFWQRRFAPFFDFQEHRLQ